MGGLSRPVLALLLLLACKSFHASALTVHQENIVQFQPLNSADYPNDDDSMGDGSGVGELPPVEHHHHKSVPEPPVEEPSVPELPAPAAEPEAVDHSHHHHSPSVPEVPLDVEDDSDELSVEVSEEEVLEDINHILTKAKLNRTKVLVPTSIDSDSGEDETESDEQQPRTADSEYVGSKTLVLQSSDPGDSAITFSGVESFVQASVTGFAACPGYDLTLQFRSNSPHGLLVFLRQVPDHSAAPGTRMHQYLFLRNGRLGVRTVAAGKRHTFISKIGGLQDDEWHTATVSLSCDVPSVTLAVDQRPHETREVPILQGQRGAPTGTARLWVGGLPSSAIAEEQPLLTVSKFTGCIRNLQLLQEARGQGGEDTSSLEEDRAAAVLTVVRANNVTAGLTCVDKCLKEDPCTPGARCINHYSHASCDCSALQAAGPHCDSTASRVLSFSGDGYLQHDLYRWRDRVQRRSYRVALHFRTNTSDSVLLLGRALHPNPQLLALSLDGEGRLRVGAQGGLASGLHIQVDGLQQPLQPEDESAMPSLADNIWHHVVISYTSDHEDGTLVHLDPHLYFGYSPALNQACQHYSSTGDQQCAKGDLAAAGTAGGYYQFDGVACVPLQYSGCGGTSNRFRTEQQCRDACVIEGLWSQRPFMGCMKKVFVDGSNLLEELSEGGDGLTRHTGHVQLEESCQQESSQVLSFTTPRSVAPLPPMPSSSPSGVTLQLSFRVKSKEEASEGVLASGRVLMAGTLTRWMVYSDGSHLSFRLDNDLLHIKSENKIKEEAWNMMSLRADSSTVSLSLNNLLYKGAPQVAMSFVSGVTLGAERAALEGCIKEVTVDGDAIDLRAVASSDKGVVFDGCALLGPCDACDSCQNGGQCSLSAAGDAHCDCAATGYEGNRCQFAKFPTSCEGYRRHGFNTSGHYNIDIDGPGPEPPLAVVCRFLDDGTVTEIEHDIPADFVVRKKGFKNHRINVDYSGLSNTQLTDMMASATSCQQNIAFECRRARLRLSSETWFASPQRKLISNMGTGLPGICPCKLAEECASDSVPCNCDMNDGATRRDSGTITSHDQLPITSLYFIMDLNTIQDKSKGTLTLGNLECYQQGVPEDSVSLLDTESFLELPLSHTDAPLSSIGFGFRTSASRGTVLHKPSFHPLQSDYRIIIVSSNILEFQYRHKNTNQTVTFHTSYLLNAASWQYVWIDFSSDQIRVVLNGLQKFINLNHDDETLKGDVYLGGTPSDLHAPLYEAPSSGGLIGCFRDLMLNMDPMSVQQVVKRSPSLSYTLGCSLSCDPNPCQNSAKCLEKPAGDYECVCDNPFAEWGKNCQHSLNDNSVTILNSATEMRYNNESTDPSNSINPLRRSVKFSFRTREVQGLVLFALDHVQNVLQMYLSKPNEFTMLWNTGQSLRSMIIDTGDLALNTGEMVQIFLNRSRSNTELNLLTQHQLFQVDEDVGVKLIEENQYQQYPYGSVIPHPELALYDQPARLPKPRLRIHLAGANSEGVHSKIPGLVGCLSGFKICHNPIQLDDRTSWTWNRRSYQIGCYSSCSSGGSPPGGCQHGGLCMDVFDKGTQQYTQCDCSLTSYTGDACDEEVAYEFSGRDTIIFKNPYGVFNGPFSADFAFAITDNEEGSKTSAMETLLIVRETPSEDSGPGDVLAVGLQGGTVLRILARIAAISPSKLLMVETDLRDLNISDGYRYHLTVGVADDIKLQINDVPLATKTVHSSEGGEWLGSSQDSLVVGGVGDLQAEGNPIGDWTNFRGCISNIQFRTRDKKVFLPLADYDGNAEDLQSFDRIGLPNRTVCSKFEDKTSKIAMRNHKAYQVARSSVPEPKDEPAREPFQALVREEPEPEDEGYSTISLIGFFVVGAVLVASFIYVWRISRKEKPVEATTLGTTYQRVDDGQEMGRKDSSSSSSSSSKSSKDSEEGRLLGDNLTGELTETKETANGETVTVDPSLGYVQYVSELPSKEENKTEQTQDDNDEVKDTHEVVEEAKSIDDDVFDSGKESHEDATGIDPGLQEEQPTITESVNLNLDVVKERSDDKLTVLDNNELEASNTKLSESCEDILVPEPGGSSTSESSSTSHSSSSENDDKPNGTNKKKESRKRKKRGSKQGFYDLQTGEQEEPESNTPQEASDAPETGDQQEPKIVSASELEKISQEESTEVEAVDAQKYFISRKNAESPEIPPKKDKN